MSEPLIPLVIDLDNITESVQATVELTENLTENEAALLMAGFKPASMHNPIDHSDPIAPHERD